MRPIIVPMPIQQPANLDSLPHWAQLALLLAHVAALTVTVVIVIKAYRLK